jgi:hypothetical protein
LGLIGLLGGLFVAFVRPYDYLFQWVSTENDTNAIAERSAALLAPRGITVITALFCVVL